MTSKAKVKIVLQFREHANMTYDLDCEGVPLTLRVFSAEEQWRIEARSKDAGDATIANGFGATRSAALTDVVRAWNEEARVRRSHTLDGAALADALREVKAI
jgi:hypothetical protein